MRIGSLTQIYLKQEIRLIFLVVLFLTKTSSANPVYLATIMTPLVTVAFLILYPAIIKAVAIKEKSLLPMFVGLRNTRNVQIAEVDSQIYQNRTTLLHDGISRNF